MGLEGQQDIEMSILTALLKGISPFLCVTQIESSKSVLYLSAKLLSFLKWARLTPKFGNETC